jgi:hypothetical protein
MIVKFKGRSADTNTFKKKPIKKGHKVFALCWRGYTWDWRYNSRTQGIINSGSKKKARQIQASEDETELTPTSKMVLDLAKTLPEDKLFHIYMGNYFTSVPLFQAREMIATGLSNRKYGACPSLFYFRRQLSCSVESFYRDIRKDAVLISFEVGTIKNCHIQGPKA